MRNMVNLILGSVLLLCAGCGAVDSFSRPYPGVNTNPIAERASNITINIEKSHCESGYYKGQSVDVLQGKARQVVTSQGKKRPGNMYTFIYYADLPGRHEGDTEWYEHWYQYYDTNVDGNIDECLYYKMLIDRSTDPRKGTGVEEISRKTSEQSKRIKDMTKTRF